MVKLYLRSFCTQTRGVFVWSCWQPVTLFIHEYLKKKESVILKLKLRAVCRKVERFGSSICQDGTKMKEKVSNDVVSWYQYHFNKTYIMGAGMALR